MRPRLEYSGRGLCLDSFAVLLLSQVLSQASGTLARRSRASATLVPQAPVHNTLPQTLSRRQEVQRMQPPEIHSLEIGPREVQALFFSNPNGQACQDLRAWLLLDCRTPEEHATASIAGATLIPMQEIPQRVAELEAWRTQPIVVHCHHGMRSLQVVQWLRKQGFAQAQSMSGGIDAWSKEIDPSVGQY